MNRKDTRKQLQKKQSSQKEYLQRQVKRMNQELEGKQKEGETGAKDGNEKRENS
ncbi:hypothetical protein [Priestia megaterium]|uniref:hypothetical protein n=1 Tax=Priestia megaterium TaxID=1404 RepID=UPI00372D3DFD